MFSRVAVGKKTTAARRIKLAFLMREIRTPTKATNNKKISKKQPFY